MSANTPNKEKKIVVASKNLEGRKYKFCEMCRSWKKKGKCNKCRHSSFYDLGSTGGWDPFRPLSDQDPDDYMNWWRPPISGTLPDNNDR